MLLFYQSTKLAIKVYFEVQRNYQSGTNGYSEVAKLNNYTSGQDVLDMERRFRFEKDSRLLNIQNLFLRDKKDRQLWEF